MAETLRTFIAVELNDPVKETIRKLQEQFKPLGCDISWVKPENIHLTLKFLGDIKPKMIEPLTEALTPVCRGIHPIQTELTGLGVFPDPRRPRVLWVGLNDTDGKLRQLATTIEEALGRIGFSKERRPFQTHITIGRIRSPRKLGALCDAIEGYKLPLGLTQNINRAVLYKSTLTPAGPIYTNLSTFTFQ